VGCFFIGKQKVVLLSKYRKNGWEFATSALIGTGQKIPQITFFCSSDVCRNA
jgi:hypothetical protein